MKLNRVMLAAPKSGSGKTMLTCALLQTLKDMGQKAVSYKCGPDYIDPMFHEQVIGVPAKNLDTFFTGTEETKRLFLRDREEGEIAVLEGVMGLYDGLGGIREEGSSYHLAEITGTPIILVVDAKGMGRSVIAMIAGFLKYDRGKLIRGVILNRMSKSYFELLSPLLEKELNIPVVGYFPEKKQLQIESRHLGLTMPEELSDIKEKLREAAAEFQRTVSLDKILQIAEEAEELGAEKATEKALGKTTVLQWADFGKPVIAVARDEAFCFYYEDNLRLLQQYGAELRYFSPLRDEKLPERCCGILLGGGYPELHGEELGRNTGIMAAIKSALAAGMPVVAECGGFMYLHETMEDKEKRQYKMVGAIPGNCSYTGKLVRFGYIEIEESGQHFLPSGEKIKGHEFHYFDSENNGEGCVAVKPVTGKQYSCVQTGKNFWLGFPHLYYPSNPVFAQRFVEKVREYQNGKFVSLF